tara:strand:+ start:2082 stop:3485 length:1404 start_codon:yes stop_codon:yes gene_type:complete
MSTISNGESGLSVRTKLNASLVITDAISDTASGVIISDTERTKLGTIEDGADVTDAINVASSGALMDSDFTQPTGSLFKDSTGVYHAIKSNLSASIDPTVNDDVTANYEPFSFWINTSTTPRKIFICTDSTDGAAVWDKLGSKWGEITGTLSSQTDLQSALDAKEDAFDDGTTAQYYRGDKTFRDLDKTAVGLPNVDNTSDVNKPVSTATQVELDEKQNTISLTTTGTSGVATFVGATLNVPDYGSGSSSAAWGGITGTLSNQTDLQTALNLKADQSSISNVDNTSDANKPVSTAGQTALDLKADLTGATFTGAVSATNLSGTNTGDQDISGIATNTSAIATKLSTTGGAMTGAITGNVAITGFRPYLRETTTARTLSLTDAGTFISAENASGTEVTIPTNASVAFTQGTEIDFIQKTEGALSITGDTGVTLNGELASAGTVTVTAQWGGVTIKLIATNEWIAVGKI